MRKASVIPPPVVWRTLRALIGLLLLVGCTRREKTTVADDGLRLVSTAPNLTECVFAVGAGDRLVGRTETCDYPPEAQRIPAVGGFGTPYLEPLLAARPTHILETIFADPDMRTRLEALRIPVVHVPCSKLDEVPAALRQIGALTGHQTQAAAVAERLEQGILQARRAAALRAERPRVLLLLASDAPITTGSRTFLSELLELAGGTNIASGEDSAYFRFSLEWLLTQNPDMILCYFSTSDDPTALFERQTGWKALAAVRQRRVYAVSDLDTVCRPGPRLLEGLAELKHIVERDRRRTNE